MKIDPEPIAREKKRLFLCVTIATTTTTSCSVLINIPLSQLIHSTTNLSDESNNPLLYVDSQLRDIALGMCQFPVLHGCIFPFYLIDETAPSGRLWCPRP
jgi:hypothetical protein